MSAAGRSVIDSLVCACPPAHFRWRPATSVNGECRVFVASNRRRGGRVRPGGECAVWSKLNRTARGHVLQICSRFHVKSVCSRGGMMPGWCTAGCVRLVVWTGRVGAGGCGGGVARVGGEATILTYGSRLAQGPAEDSKESCPPSQGRGALRSGASFMRVVRACECVRVRVRVRVRARQSRVVVVGLEEFIARLRPCTAPAHVGADWFIVRRLLQVAAVCLRTLHQAVRVDTVTAAREAVRGHVAPFQ